MAFETERNRWFADLRRQRAPRPASPSPGSSSSSSSSRQRSDVDLIEEGRKEAEAALEERQKQQEAAAKEREAADKAAKSEAQKARNNRLEAEYRRQGRSMYVDAHGDIQPIHDDATWQQQQADKAAKAQQAEAEKIARANAASQSKADADFRRQRGAGINAGQAAVAQTGRFYADDVAEKRLAVDQVEQSNQIVARQLRDMDDGAIPYDEAKRTELAAANQQHLAELDRLKKESIDAQARQMEWRKQESQIEGQLQTAEAATPTLTAPAITPTAPTAPAQVQVQPTVKAGQTVNAAPTPATEAPPVPVDRVQVRKEILSARITAAEQAGKADKAALLKLRRDDPAKWTLELSRARAQMAIPELADYLNAEQDDLIARRAELEGRAEALGSLVTAEQQKIDELRQRNTDLLSQGYIPAHTVTLKKEDGSEERWANEALAQQYLNTVQQVNRAMLDHQAQGERLGVALNEHHREVEQLDVAWREFNERAQADTEARYQQAEQDYQIPGLAKRMQALDKQQADRLAGIQAQSTKPELAKAAQEAIAKDIDQQRAGIFREVEATHRQKEANLKAASNVYSSYLDATTEGGDGNPAWQEAVTRLSKETGLNKLSANRLLYDLEAADFSRQRAKGAADHARLKSDGGLVLNPTIWGDKRALEKAIDGADTSEEAKAHARDLIPDYRLAYAGQIRPVLEAKPDLHATDLTPLVPLTRSLEKLSGKSLTTIPTFERWKKRHQRAGSDQDILDYLDEMQTRPGWAKFADAIETGLTAGGMDLLSMGLGVAAMGSFSIVPGANEAGAKLAGKTSQVAASLSNPMVAEGSTGTLGLDIAGQGARMVPPAAALIATGGLAGLSMKGLSALAGSQTAGAQFAETYRTLTEDQGKSHEEAWNRAAPFAITSGIVTAALTYAGGKTGLEKLAFQSPDKAAGVVKKGFSGWVTRLRNAAGEIGTDALAEIGEELPDELFSQISEALAKDPKADLDAIVMEFVRNAPALIGAVGLMGAAGGLPGAARALSAPDQLARPAPKPTPAATTDAAAGTTPAAAPVPPPVPGSPEAESTPSAQPTASPTPEEVPTATESVVSPTTATEATPDLRIQQIANHLTTRGLTTEQAVIAAENAVNQMGVVGAEYVDQMAEEGFERAMTAQGWVRGKGKQWVLADEEAWKAASGAEPPMAAGKPATAKASTTEPAAKAPVQPETQAIVEAEIASFSNPDITPEAEDIARTRARALLKVAKGAQLTALTEKERNGLNYRTGAEGKLERGYWKPNPKEGTLDWVKGEPPANREYLYAAPDAEGKPALVIRQEAIDLLGQHFPETRKQIGLSEEERLLQLRPPAPTGTGTGTETEAPTEADSGASLGRFISNFTFEGQEIAKFGQSRAWKTAVDLAVRQTAKSEADAKQIRERLTAVADMIQRVYGRYFDEVQLGDFDGGGGGVLLIPLNPDAKGAATRFALGIDPALFAQMGAVTFKGSGAMLHEELIHAVLSRLVPLEDQIRIAQELHAANPRLFAKAYRSYFSVAIEDELMPAAMPETMDRDLAVWAFQETSRMLLQGRLTGQTTENVEIPEGIRSSVIRFLERIMDFLKREIRKVPKDIAEEWATYLDNAELALRYLERGDVRRVSDLDSIEPPSAPTTRQRARAPPATLSDPTLDDELGDAADAALDGVESDSITADQQATLDEELAKEAILAEEGQEGGNTPKAGDLNRRLGALRTATDQSGFMDASEARYLLSTPPKQRGEMAQNMARETSWMERTAKGLGFRGVEELTAKNPELFQRMARRWSVIQSLDSEGKQVQTRSIHAIFDALYGTGKTSTATRLRHSRDDGRRFATQAENDARRENRTSGRERPETRDRGETASAEEAFLIDWAREHGLLLSTLPEQFRPGQGKDVGATEHHVFIPADSDRVVKVTRLPDRPHRHGLYPVPHLEEWDLREIAATGGRYIEKINAANALLGDDIVMHGVYLPRGGRAQIITSQPFFAGQKPLDRRKGNVQEALREVIAAMREIGFEPVSDDQRTYYRPEDNAAIFDAHLENLIWVEDEGGDTHLVPFDVSVVHPPEGSLRQNLRTLAGLPPRAVTPLSSPPRQLQRQTRDVTAGFYSQLAEVLAAKMPNRATPKQIEGIVLNTKTDQPKDGIKVEELKWTGLLPWLRAQPATTPLDKQTVLDWLATEGKVTLEEVRLGQQRPPTIRAVRWGEFKAAFPDRVREVPGHRPAVDQDWVVMNGNDILGPTVEAPDETSALDQYDIIAGEAEVPSTSETKYHQYQLPGGENYREVVLARPVAEESQAEANREAIYNQLREDYTRQHGSVDDAEDSLNDWFQGDITDDELAEEIGLDPADYTAEETQFARSESDYTSSHFANVPNYVAHMRLNERHDAEGRPGLFLEELQSDRHQAGREKGYREDQLTAQARVREIEEKGTSATTEEKQEWAALMNQGAMRQDGPADAPHRKDWPLALFKRALRDAVATGKDWIGWTTGDTQAERYDLSKMVERIKVLEYSYQPGFYTVTAWKNGTEVIQKADVPKSELSALIGKDLARKAVDDIDTTKKNPVPKWAATFSGLDLKVGGQGMKGFYDTILPKEIGKYVKQWGAKVETVPLNDFDEPEPIHRVNITPQMRQGVTAGQPLFASPRQRQALGSGLRDLLPEKGGVPADLRQAYAQAQAGQGTAFVSVDDLQRASGLNAPAFARALRAGLEDGTFLPEPADSLAAAAGFTHALKLPSGMTVVRVARGPDTLDTAAHDAATSPTNGVAEPTDDQKKAGNYKLGHVRMGGLEVSVENPAGSERRGTDPSGKPWAITLKDHYGYFRGTKGSDGDHLDLFFPSGLPADYQPDTVHLIRQNDPDTGRFDEYKVMVGYPDEATARAAYLRNYAPGWKGLGAIGPMKWARFKDLATSGAFAKARTGDREIALASPAKQRQTSGMAATDGAAQSNPEPSPGGLFEAEEIEDSAPGKFRLFNAIMSASDPGPVFSDSISVQRPGYRIAGFFLGASPEAVAGYGDTIKELEVTITNPLVLDDENYTPQRFAQEMQWGADVWPDYDFEDAGSSKEPVYTYFSPGMLANPVDSRNMADQLVQRGFDAVVMWDDSAYEGSKKRPTVWIPYSKAENIRVLNTVNPNSTRAENGAVQGMGVDSRGNGGRMASDSGAAQNAEPSPGGLSEAEVIVPVAFRGQQSAFEVEKLPPGGWHFSSDEEYARSYMLEGMRNVPDELATLTEKALYFKSPLDLRGAKTRIDVESALRQSGVPLETSVELYPFTQNPKYQGVKTIGEWLEFLEEENVFGEDFVPNESLTDHLGEAVRPFVDGIIFDEHGLPDLTSYVVLRSDVFNPESTRAENGAVPLSASPRQLAGKAADLAGKTFTKGIPAVADAGLSAVTTASEAIKLGPVLGKWSRNELDKWLFKKFTGKAWDKVDNGLDAVKTYLERPNAGALTQLAKATVDQALPNALASREWLALYYESQRKAAWGREQGMDVMRSLTGEAKISDLGYPAQYTAPVWRTRLFEAMEAEASNPALMAALPPELQAVATKLRLLLNTVGREMVKQRIMSYDTFEELSTGGYMPRYTLDDADAQSGSLMAKAKLAVKDMDQQRTTAWHIVDTTRKNRNGQYETLSYDDEQTGKKNRWRFRGEQHRDAYYEGFVREQAFEMLQSGAEGKAGAKEVTTMLAPLTNEKKRIVRAEIATLTREKMDQPARLSTELQGIVRRAVLLQRVRYKKEAPSTPETLVKDPIYAVSRYVAANVHNAATMELFRATASHPDWVSKEALQGYTKMPDSDRLGPLAKLHVRDDIAQQLNELVTIPGTVMRFYDGALKKWKGGKLVLNPGSHIRDAVGNTMFATLAGTSIWNPGNLPHYREALNILRNGGDGYAELLERQVLEGDAYSSLVRSHLRGLIPDPKVTSGITDEGIVRLMLGFGSKLRGAFDVVAELRKFPDNFYKTAAYLKYKADGMSPEAAAAEVRKWFPYYDRLGRSATWRGVGRFVNPFASFMRESTRIFGTGMRERPVAMAAMMSFPAMITMLAVAMLKLGEEDEKVVKEGMRGKLKFGPKDLPVFSMLLPMRSGGGQLQQWDLASVIPFADLIGTRVEDYGHEDAFQKFIRGLVAGSPFISILSDWAYNTNSWNGQKIVQDDMSFGERWATRADNAAANLLPPITPFAGTAWRTVANAGRRQANKSMAMRDVPQSLSRGILGMDLRNADPSIYDAAEAYREANDLPLNNSSSVFSIPLVSRLKKELREELVQDRPDPESISTIIERLENADVKIRSPKDIRDLLNSMDPRTIIRSDHRGRFIASLSPEQRRGFDLALAELDKATRRAPKALQEARALLSSESDTATE